MPTTNRKTRKSAKTTSRSASKSAKTKTKSSAMPKATAARTKSKSARASSKAAGASSKSKSRAAVNARSGAKTARGASTKARSIARSAAKTSEVKSARIKAAAKAAKADKANSIRAESAKASAAGKAQTRRAASATAAVVARKGDHATSSKNIKTIESRGKAPARTETSPNKSKASQTNKGLIVTQSKATASQKAAHPTSVRVEAPSAKAPAGKAEANHAPVPGKAAPESRPASSAPVVQPRDRSEQNPVPHKKTISPSAAKPAPALKPAAPPAETARAGLPPAAKASKAAGAKLGFKTNEHIVYPAHGVGQIIAIEEQEVAGFKLELFVISFVKDKMILKVPTPKVASVGMRKLAEAPVISKSLDTLTGRARIKRTMWSRRAQEYEAKINSGDLIAIAEVVRDLYRSEAQPEQSYSERQLYEAALDRMARELAVVQKITEQESLKLIEAQLQKGPRRVSKAEADVDLESGDVDEAA